ncbi:MAG: GNAT family N-acetyltransferase [Pseudomonadota bacterium]
MEIRPHRPKDFQQLTELRWLLKTEDDPTVSEDKKANFQTAYFNQLHFSEKLGDTVHFVIDDAPKIAGALTIRIVRKELAPVSEASSWGYLTNTYVTNECRGRGLGSKLLNNAIAWAREIQLELLIVWPSERSYSFYRAAGFCGESDPLELVL